MAKSNSSRTAAASVPHLPMDLITDNILSRLPVKSLIRFKSVSKPWLSLIESPHFINLHLNFSKLNPHPIFSSILSVHETSKDKYVFRLNFIDAIDKPIAMDFSFMSGRDCRVLGISNGLLCLMFGWEFSPDTIIVCNLVTGNFRRIPPFIVDPMLGNPSFYGLNSNENGFELIGVKYSYGGVKVSSFSSRANIWKDVQVKMGKHIISTEPMKFVQPLYTNLVPVFKNGVFYWDGYRKDSPCVVILDLFNEEFDVIPPPGDDDDDFVDLVVFKEQIMIVICACRQLDLWVLNENDKTWRMLKLIDVSDSIPGNDPVGVLGCTGNGQLVLSRVYESHSEVYLCDIDTDDINILTYVNVGRMDRMYLFAESLESVETSEFGDEV